MIISLDQKLVIKHHFKTFTEKTAMQMSSLELCNWLVISLLSFFVCGKDSDGCAAQRDLEQVVFGIYSINAEGGDATTTPVDVGIVTEGVEVLHDLGDIASACALLMGVIYAMNLSYPHELKTLFRKSSSSWMLPDSQPRYRCLKTNCMSEPTLSMWRLTWRPALHLKLFNWKTLERLYTFFLFLCDTHHCSGWHACKACPELFFCFNGKDNQL